MEGLKSGGGGGHNMGDIFSMFGMQGGSPIINLNNKLRTSRRWKTGEERKSSAQETGSQTGGRLLRKTIQTQTRQTATLFRL
jgi:hypothetical protein